MHMDISLIHLGVFFHVPTATAIGHVGNRTLMIAQIPIDIAIKPCKQISSVGRHFSRPTLRLDKTQELP